MAESVQSGDVRSGVARAVRGGSFLIERHDPAAVLIPEAFDEELKLTGQTAATFVEREIQPVFKQLEKLDYDLSRKMMARAGELGLLGVDVPEEYGGLALSKTASMLVAEKLSRSGSFNVTFNAHAGIGTLPLVFFGTDKQKENYLPQLASGELIAAYALSEPGSGSDSRAAKTTALLNDEGTHYVVNGTKMWISNAGFADLFTVFVQIDGDRFSALLVDRDTPGLSLGAEERKMGIKGSSTRQLIFEDALVPVSNVLGEIGRGHVIAFSILNLGRLKLAAGAIGGIKEMLRLAVRYAQEREQFGVPIGSFGLIQEKIGAMQANAFALESAVYRLTGDIDANLQGVQGDAAVLARLEEFLVEYSFIKVFGSEILDDAIDETLQIFGGNGFSAEYPIELAYRNSRVNRIFEGTNEINRLLTTGQLLRRALKGQLDLLDAAQRAMQGKPAAAAEVPAALQAASDAVAGLKQAVLLVAGAAAMAWMQATEEEQEVLARVADMIALVYLAESALFRAERLAGTSREEAACLLARLYAFDAVDRGRQLAVEALRRIPQGSALLGTLLGHLPEAGVDLIQLRRDAADRSLAAGGYLLD
jgi:alkylation response protein AidB-like acyl-CoA dehydrogenase